MAVVGGVAVVAEGSDSSKGTADVLLQRATIPPVRKGTIKFVCSQLPGFLSKAKELHLPLALSNDAMAPLGQG